MFHIIYNPFSGRKKKKNQQLDEVFKYLDENKVEYKLYKTEYYRHPFDLSKQITEENESGNIIVIGGDGTLSEVINGIKDLSKWNIGIIPAGSGNDFVSCLGIEIDPLENIKTILKENITKVDYIKVNDGMCLNILGTGIDVEVLQNFERHTKLRGKFRYLYSLLEALLKVRWHEFDVSIDDGPFEHKVGFIITLCNGCNFGGGITICPGADPTDGKLEFVMVNKMKKIKILGSLIKLMKKKVFTMKETEHIYCKKAVFRDNEKLVIQIDGNISKDYNEYRCEVVPQGLNIYK